MLIILELYAKIHTYNMSNVEEVDIRANDSDIRSWLTQKTGLALPENLGNVAFTDGIIHAQIIDPKDGLRPARVDLSSIYRASNVQDRYIAASYALGTGTSPAYLCAVVMSGTADEFPVPHQQEGPNLTPPYRLAVRIYDTGGNRTDDHQGPQPEGHFTCEAMHNTGHNQILRLSAGLIKPQEIPILAEPLQYPNPVGRVVLEYTPYLAKIGLWQYTTHWQFSDPGYDKSFVFSFKGNQYTVPSKLLHANPC